MIPNLVTKLRQLTLCKTPVTGVLGTLQCAQPIQHSNIHISAINYKHSPGYGDKDPTHFLSYNEKFYPVQGFEEERRPAVSYI